MQPAFPGKLERIFSEDATSPEERRRKFFGGWRISIYGMVQKFGRAQLFVPLLLMRVSGDRGRGGEERKWWGSGLKVGNTGHPITGNFRQSFMPWSIMINEREGGDGERMWW